MLPLFGGGGVLGDSGGLLSGVACSQSCYLDAGAGNTSRAEEEVRLYFGSAACSLSCSVGRTSAQAAAETLQCEGVNMQSQNDSNKPVAAVLQVKVCTAVQVVLSCQAALCLVTQQHSNRSLHSAPTVANTPCLGSGSLH